MASSLRIVVSRGISGIYTPAAGLAAGGGVDVSIGPKTVTRVNGTESTQCDCVYYKGDATIATSTTTSYDLAGGSLEQPDGTSFAPARIDLIVVENTGTVPVYVGPHATAGCGATTLTKANGDLLVVNPGKIGILEGPVAGAVVTATTADIIAVENPSASVVAAYRIAMFGRTV